MNTNKRIQKLRDGLQGHGLDAMLVSTPENRRYLSGFSGSAGYLLISQRDAVLATDFRYVEQAARQAQEFKIERIGAGRAWLPKLVSEMRVRRLGFESDHVTVDIYSALGRAIQEAEGTQGFELISTKGVVEKLRIFKDADELGLLAKAVEIADQAFEQVAPNVEPGVTEREVAWELEKAMRERGAEASAFDIIVGTGVNGALPHHRADETMIGRNEAVVIDMGARYEGYCSDLTRTIIVGEPDETFLRVYSAVLSAQLTGEEQIIAGMTGGEADAVARDVITKAGYGDNFGHSLGHGVGLAVHEDPRVSLNSEEPLEDGMVFTVEPGIYISGWGGVRIEDMVVLENGHIRVLSRAQKLEWTK